MKAFHSHRDEPGPSIVKCLEWTAAAQKVLVVGHARESLLERLDARGCTITCLLLGAAGLDQAGVFCTTVKALPPDHGSLLPLLNGSRFDAVVLDGALDLASDPAPLIADGRLLLHDNGALIALFSGSVGVRELFDAAGYRVERFDRIPGAQDSARFALLAKPVVSRLADRTLEMRSHIDEIERLRSAHTAAQSRLKDYERQLLRTQIATRALRSDLEAEVIARSSLQRLLEERAEALSDLRKESAQVEEAWYALFKDSESLRAGIAGLEEALASAVMEAHAQTDRADRMTAAESATNAWAESLQQKNVELHFRIAAQVESENAAREQLAREVELRQCLSGELDDARASILETERRLNEEMRELRSRVADAEGALASQTDALIDATRSEAAKLSALIDTVQSSRFWQLKRWLSRLRGRALGF